MPLPKLNFKANQPVRLFSNLDHLNDTHFIRGLFRITGILIIIHLISLVMGSPSWQFDRLFALGEEANVPTWFSSGLWAIASFVAYRCSTFVRAKDQSFCWGFISAVFLAFSIDEVAMIHENVFGILAKYFPTSIRTNVIDHFKATNWPIIAVPFLIFAVILLIAAFKRLALSRLATKWIFVGFLVTIFGGYVLEITTNFLNHNELQWLWDIENVVEESFEMFGVLFIISGLIKQFEFLTQPSSHQRHPARLETKEPIYT